MSILYFWREECPPCREMRQRLEGLISSGGIPNSWGTTAVYGPEHATLLREQYQVAIAPTILFTVDGRVDSRLVGENYEQVLLNEIEIITDQVTG
jgi:thiol-disulfide isomerase/thioredoxin